MTLLIPAHVEGALVSTGDVHHAQGDCEACGTAIEMRSRVHVRFGVRKGEAEQLGIHDLQLVRDDYFAEPELAAPRRFFATTGIRLERSDGLFRTALSFVTDDRLGDLHGALEPFARSEINLMQLVSRPIPQTPWRYRFDAVLAGHPLDAPVPVSSEAMRVMP